MITWCRVQTTNQHNGYNGNRIHLESLAQSRHTLLFQHSAITLNCAWIVGISLYYTSLKTSLLLVSRHYKVTVPLFFIQTVLTDFNFGDNCVIQPTIKTFLHNIFTT